MGMKMAENFEEYPDRIADFYANKTVFITGGTGFMGKALIEKLLRSCHDLKKIILMVRSKKGKHPQDRVKEIFAGPLFDMVKKQKGPDIVKKVQAIVGDVMLPNMGLCQEDREMLTNEVHVIFHCAATIRFDEPLKKTVLLNVRGTKFMLDLAKECKNLLVFAHMSTAYCHLNERILYEKAYPPPADPHKVIQTVEWLSDDIIDTITPKLLGDYPNTYAFTKALGEALVADEKDNLPVIILRPSIVIPMWREPIPGWTDNINGPTGLLIGAGKGVIRTMYIKDDSYADYLPVDIAVNCAILCACDYILHNSEVERVDTLSKDTALDAKTVDQLIEYRSNFKGQARWIYNLTSSAEYKITMEEIIEMGRKVVNTRIPLNGVAWYPGGSMKRSKIVHYICFFLFHMIPAVLVDALLITLGYKPVLIKVQKRIWKGFEVFEYYANNQWDFDNEDSMRARDLLNPREKETWKCDGDGISYLDYFTHCVHAARLYILKETDDTLPAARRHMFIMWIVDRVCKGLFLVWVFYYLYKKLLNPLMEAYVQ